MGSSDEEHKLIYICCHSFAMLKDGVWTGPGCHCEPLKVAWQSLSEPALEQSEGINLVKWRISF